MCTTDRRPILHQLLKELFDGDPHVYFQPPSSVKLIYPCIVYKLADLKNFHADNGIYIGKRMYQLTVIDRNPDSSLRENVIHALCKKFPGRFERSFVSDNLNHYVFRIYY